ncbi:hypothetical protein Ctob_016278, partial [Chrysochromulina tobinii]
MASIGQSKQTVQARAKQLKDGNAFLNYIETASEDGELATRWGTVWEEVSEEELGQRDIWAHLATYFVEVHRIEEGVKNAGELLDINTAQVDRLINQARNALEHSIRMNAKAKAFFDALKDESSADSVWFRGVNNNMTRMIALRKAANCESFDHSAEEIYMEHIKAISAALLDGGRQQSGGGKAAGRHDIV